MQTLRSLDAAGVTPAALPEVKTARSQLTEM